MTTQTDVASPGQTALADADALVEQGRWLEAIDRLHQASTRFSDPDVERRLAVIRYQAFENIEHPEGFATWPVPVDGLDVAGPAQIPQVAPADLDAATVRRGIRSRGSVHVPGLLNAEQVAAFVEGIEYVLALRTADEGSPIQEHSSWVRSLPVPQPAAQTLARKWVAGDGGMLACDSPKLLDLMFRTYEKVGLREVVRDYLGERPALSANKGTLRRARIDGKTDWHQDGAFLGDGLRALNVWVALTDCGVDAPTMDLVPKRFETLQETGTGGAIFDWAVGPDTVAQISTDAPVVRPHFKAGDCMLFDELCLHRTGLAPEMTKTRHAIESWFFAPSAYPDGQVPVVW